MAIILFGGSFDPVHNGHLAMARAALDFLPSARLVMIPAACSPFKMGRSMASEQHRLAMCRLAVGDDPHITVSDIEFSMEKPSYTVRTVERLQLETADDYYFLCGADSFLSLARWKEYQKLLSMVSFLVANRDGAADDALQAQKRWVEQNGGTAYLLSMPRVDVSSTQVRQDATEQSHLLPPLVARYIQENGLYKE